jgi:hypothetical protein
MTAPPAKHKVDDYVWTVDYYRKESELLKGVAWYENYRIWSLVLIVCTTILVVSFW